MVRINILFSKKIKSQRLIIIKISILIVTESFFSNLLINFHSKNNVTFILLYKRSLKLPFGLI